MASGAARVAGVLATPDEGTYAYDDATITLDLPSDSGSGEGAPEALSLRVPVGPVGIDALLGTARAVSGRVTLRVLAHEEARGRPVSCAKGCTHCCHHLILVSSVEARAVARAVAAMEPARQARVRARFALARDRLVEAELLARDAPRGSVGLRARTKPGDARAAWEDVSRRYFSLRMPCPMLEDDACTVHELAPLVCREYHVTSPAEFCATLGHERTVPAPRPVRMSEALAAAGAAAAAVSDQMVPLSLALEWDEAHGHALEGAFDGEKLFEALMGAISEAE